MGFRTVVMLSNDWSHEWSKDPKLGEKIHHAMSMHNFGRPDESRIGSYGAVVQVTHADEQSLVRLDHYTGFEPISSTCRRFGPSTDEDLLALVKSAADQLGYRLAKKPTKR